MSIIDPKFNDLPVDAEGEIRRDTIEPMTAEEEAELKRRRAGLSIKETVAAEAGEGRGVTTSGVTTGSEPSSPRLPPPVIKP